MRKIILDTESTGLDPFNGHRLVEIGCVELKNYIPTGATYHTYINPQRDVPKEAFDVHGLDYEFLKNHPLFSEISAQFLDFIQDDCLVIHNARFDMKFLNFELKACNLPEISFDRAVDTLRIAKEKFPGAPASLDALCKRFNIDNSGRVKHGALLDAELLADVYLELIGGRQTAMDLESRLQEGMTNLQGLDLERPYREPRTHSPSEEELRLHQDLLKKLNASLWET
jgi:DNA polymerase-3 subunit epsilon